MAEKRRMKRRHLIYYLSVFDRLTNHFVGQLVDITTEGIMLTSETKFELDTLHKLKMVLPEKIMGKNEILFDAQSLWSKQSINPNFYDTGFRLSKISKQDIAIIKHLIYDFSFQS